MHTKHTCNEVRSVLVRQLAHAHTTLKILQSEYYAHTCHFLHRALVDAHSTLILLSSEYYTNSSHEY